MFNESSSKLQSDGRFESSSVGDGTLSAVNLKSDHHPSASTCLAKCLFLRLCARLWSTKCSLALNTLTTAEEQPASNPTSMTLADKVSSHCIASQSDGPKNDSANEGTASSRPRQYTPQVAPTSSGPTRCKPPSHRLIVSKIHVN